MTALVAREKIWLDTTLGRVQVYDSGGIGPTILLVHSLLVAGDVYARLLPLLVSRGYRCLIPELPLGAHPAALKADANLTPATLAALLVEVLDGLNISQANLVGVDTGGALTQLMMANHRNRVDHVILTACDAYDAFPPRSFGPLLTLLKMPGMLKVFSQLVRWRPLRRLVAPHALTHAGVDDATLLRWTRPLLNPAMRRDLGKVLANMNPRYTLAAAEANRDFPRPVLIAWGDDDFFFPRRLGQRLAQELPHAQYVTLPDCAALAALDQPQLLARLIDDHIHDEPITI